MGRRLRNFMETPELRERKCCVVLFIILSVAGAYQLVAALLGLLWKGPTHEALQAWGSLGPVNASYSAGCSLKDRRDLSRYTDSKYGCQWIEAGEHLDKAGRQIVVVINRRHLSRWEVDPLPLNANVSVNQPLSSDAGRNDRSNLDEQSHRTFGAELAASIGIGNLHDSMRGIGIASEFVRCSTWNIGWLFTTW